MRKANISPEQEKAAYALFMDALPYYWESDPRKVPAGLRLRLALNRYPSAAMACVDIATRQLVTPKLAREAGRRLVAIQAWKGVEPQ